MALATGTIFEQRNSATTGNVNGSGFNPNNANFPTDLAGTSATGASPVVTSATYTFVAGDVGSYVYVKSGTNWIVGWYQIASVSAGAATLTASIGSVVLSINSQGLVTRNTTTGCATTASPTAGTYGVDYSQQDTAVVNGITDFTSVGASAIITSATAGFTPVMVGNFYHQTTTGTGGFGVTGWYEIVSYTNATTVTLDRTSNSGTTSVACTGYVGGAGRFSNALESAFMNMLPASAIAFFKSGVYSTGSVSVSTTNQTQSTAAFIIGYTSVRGDVCIGTNRPTFAMATATFNSGQYQMFNNIIFTGTINGIFTIGPVSNINNCKIFNSSASAARQAMIMNNTANFAVDSEFISQNGVAVGINGIVYLIGCYAHDSVNGMNFASGVTLCCITDSIIENCTTTAISNNSTTAEMTIYGNTIYGREAKMGVGISFTGANSANNKVINNIIYGCTTGISVATGVTTTNLSYNNDFFNNTTDVTNWQKSSSDLALDPQFVGATQITGTTATTSASVLTQSGGNFSTVTDNVDFLRVTSGTGVTTGGYLITSHTTTTLTVNNALGTSVAGDVNYYIGTGHNFQIGTNLASLGVPNFVNSGSETTSYPDVGAVQRQPTAGGSATVAHTFVS